MMREIHDYQALGGFPHALEDRQRRVGLSLGGERKPHGFLAHAQFVESFARICGGRDDTLENRLTLARSLLPLGQSSCLKQRRGDIVLSLAPLELPGRVAGGGGQGGSGIAGIFQQDQAIGFASRIPQDLRQVPLGRGQIGAGEPTRAAPRRVAPAAPGPRGARPRPPPSGPRPTGPGPLPAGCGQPRPGNRGRPRARRPAPCAAREPPDAAQAPASRRPPSRSDRPTRTRRCQRLPRGAVGPSFEEPAQPVVEIGRRPQQPVSQALELLFPQQKFVAHAGL